MALVIKSESKTIYITSNKIYEVDVTVGVLRIKERDSIPLDEIKEIYEVVDSVVLSLIAKELREYLEKEEGK